MWSQTCLYNRVHFSSKYHLWQSPVNAHTPAVALGCCSKLRSDICRITGAPEEGSKLLLWAHRKLQCTSHDGSASKFLGRWQHRCVQTVYEPMGSKQIFHNQTQKKIMRHTQAQYRSRAKLALKMLMFQKKSTFLKGV